VIKNSAKREVMTQEALWFRQLQISGNQPNEEHKNELFILHTFLMTVSCKLISIFSETDSAYGFATWTKNTTWFHNLTKNIEQYDWKQETRDVLRNLYMKIVDRKHRHIYGEYYTPDWVCEKVVKEVIDDSYIKEFVNSIHNKTKVGGILDPACGSGTFLYYAIKHISNSPIVRNASLNRRNLTEKLVENIHGIDIHPVAVAMTKANVLRALPEKTSQPLNIYQGDSLQIERGTEFEQNKLSEITNVFVIKSRENQEIRFPMDFVKTNDFQERMIRIGQASSNRKDFPTGVDANLSKNSKAVLKKAFNQLKKICQEEGNDVWAWYIINHATINRLRKKMARIIANPPWVRLSNIQDENRKKEIIHLSKELKVWVGGNRATSFNLGALFVVQCMKIYGENNTVKSGWVLSDSAMKGGNWSKYLELMKPSKIYNLGNLAFKPHSQSSIHFFNLPKEPTKELVLKDKKDNISDKDSWENVSKKTTFVKKINLFKTKESEWLIKKKPMARNGATLFPHCLVVLKKWERFNKDYFKCKTSKSRHSPWKNLGSYELKIPEKWLKNVLYNKGGLFPYRIGVPRKVMIPINEKGEFLSHRENEKCWKDVCDRYKKWKGKGSNTPITLEKCLNYQNKLISQFPFKKNIVVYNSNGANLYAARLKTPMIIEHSLYRVQTKNEKEALFLLGILNAHCVSKWIHSTKKGTWSIYTHFWKNIPIPRFDETNKNHFLLSQLSKEAEEIVKNIEPVSYKEIKTKLTNCGLSKRIDSVVKKIMAIS